MASCASQSDVQHWSACCCLQVEQTLLQQLCEFACSRSQHQPSDNSCLCPVYAACTRETPQRVRCTWANVGESDTKVLQFSVTGTDAGSFINTARVSSTAPGVKDKEATVPVTLLPETVPPIESVSTTVFRRPTLYCFKHCNSSAAVEKDLCLLHRQSSARQLHASPKCVQSSLTC